MDFGVVGDFVGEVSASASSLWLGSVSDSSLTDTSEPGRRREPGCHLRRARALQHRSALPGFAPAWIVPAGHRTTKRRRGTEPRRSFGGVLAWVFGGSGGCSGWFVVPLSQLTQLPGSAQAAGGRSSPRTVHAQPAQRLCPGLAMAKPDGGGEPLPLPVRSGGVGRGPSLPGRRAVTQRRAAGGAGAQEGPPQPAARARTTPRCKEGGAACSRFCERQGKRSQCRSRARRLAGLGVRPRGSRPAAGGSQLGVPGAIPARMGQREHRAGPCAAGGERSGRRRRSEC